MHIQRERERERERESYFMASWIFLFKCIANFNIIFYFTFCIFFSQQMCLCKQKGDTRSTQNAWKTAGWGFLCMWEQADSRGLPTLQGENLNRKSSSFSWSLQKSRSRLWNFSVLQFEFIYFWNTNKKESV
jgi:hypothetical protein